MGRDELLWLLLKLPATLSGNQKEQGSLAASWSSQEAKGIPRTRGFNIAWTEDLRFPVNPSPPVPLCFRI